jgi:hypothetical protein
MEKSLEDCVSQTGKYAARSEAANFDQAKLSPMRAHCSYRRAITLQSTDENGRARAREFIAMEPASLYEF